MNSYGNETYRQYIYKNEREGHYSFLLGFGRNCEIVFFKALGPDHGQRFRVSQNSWRESIKNTHK